MLSRNKARKTTTRIIFFRWASCLSQVNTSRSRLADVFWIFITWEVEERGPAALEARPGRAPVPLTACSQTLTAQVQGPIATNSRAILAKCSFHFKTLVCVIIFFNHSL
ncbi:hypothetical protein EYF80_053298 [Liparis tanakae]|uniref:Uncharacterized protein n=1 Tax=Liparis tanakae TaxID=230148 RepID=A0A4Z2F637_9TELE|nr:hypothetical protein EYF80_053298 [Liparis tanakae]